TTDPEWTEFGAGLPNALVTDLHYIPPVTGVTNKGDVLVVGTLGRGAWKITDATAKVAAPGVLQIGAFTGPLTVTLSRNTANRSLLDVSVTQGVGASATVEQKQFQGSTLQKIIVTGLSAAPNTLIIDSSKGAIDI